MNKLSNFEKKMYGFRWSSIGYYLAVFIFTFKLWKLCHREENVKTAFGDDWGSGWVFLDRFHPDDNKFFLGNL